MDRYRDIHVYIYYWSDRFIDINKEMRVLVSMTRKVQDMLHCPFSDKIM